MSKLAGNALKRFLQERSGYDFVVPRTSAKDARVLPRLHALAGPINTVIDVGASDGRWSGSVKRYWPNAQYLLVEAQDVHRDGLRHYSAANPNVTVEHAAASDRAGSLYFMNSGPFSGSASHEPFNDSCTEVPCISIDDAVISHRLPGPFLIKLDTHGHEREILTGASNTLQQSNLLVVEAYNFANFGRMMFWELCEFLHERGFRPAALSEPMVRESDELLWQMDLWFLPSSHPAFSNTGL